MKIIIPWNAIPLTVVEIYTHFSWNLGIFVSDYMAPNLWRW